MEITASLAVSHPDRLIGAVAAPPDAAATQQFAALMHPVPTEQSALQAPAISSTVGSSGSNTVGGRILDGMQNVSEKFNSSWTQVHEMLSPNSPQLGIQDLLGMQLQLTQASVWYDLLGKGISRVTQNIDQLVRLQ